MGFVVLAVPAAGQLKYTFDKILRADYNYTAGQIWPAGLSLTHVAYSNEEVVSSNPKNNNGSKRIVRS